MKEIVVIGDLHGRDTWKLIDPNKYDIIVFLGDYLDSFDIDIDTQINNLRDVVQFKLDNPDKVILLLGNHEVDNYTQPITKVGVASGYHTATHHNAYHILTEHKELFQISYQIDNYVFSHAGIHKGWFQKAIKEYDRLAKEYKFDNYDYTNPANLLNTLYKHNSKVLLDCSHHRGGYSEVSGPLWADKNETWMKPLDDYHQIVGHTQVNGFKQNIINKNTSISYCDYPVNNEGGFYKISIN
jgi:predicted phosphodiesterase